MRISGCSGVGHYALTRGHQCPPHQIAIHTLWNIRIVVLAKPEHENRISHICTDNVKTGIANTLGERAGGRVLPADVRPSGPGPRALPGLNPSLTSWDALGPGQAGAAGPPTETRPPPKHHCFEVLAEVRVPAERVSGGAWQSASLTTARGRQRCWPTGPALSVRDLGRGLMDLP